jgi:hypothetical protein
MSNFGLEFIKKLKPAKWRYQAPFNDGRDHFGFIAQDVDEIAPTSDYNFTTIKEGYYSINYWEFIGPMCKAIQELAERVEELERERKPNRKRRKEINGQDKESSDQSTETKRKGIFSRSLRYIRGFFSS